MANRKIKLDATEVEWVEGALIQAQTHVVDQLLAFQKESQATDEAQIYMEELELAKNDCEAALSILRSRIIRANAAGKRAHSRRSSGTAK